MLPQDQLISLCDETAALVRVGVPLEPALRNRSTGLPNQLGSRIRELSEKLESGQSLSDALKNDPMFPLVYASVIESGLESGNLAGALELLAQNLRLLRDARRFVVGAMLYPLLVFSVAWLMLTVVWFKLGHVFADFFSGFFVHAAAG
ncbi:MAG: type II secretion system F family protein [Planctomycetaceae bacterium]|jgi:type II secretory pathway component PulF|nr:type II secretion system F family protein [Planctomycetaceae bacterium]